MRIGVSRGNACSNRHSTDQKRDSGKRSELKGEDSFLIGVCYLFSKGVL